MKGLTCRPRPLRCLNPVLRCVFSAVLLLYFAVPVPVQAQSLLSQLPPAARLLPVSDGYTPVMLNGVVIHPENPFRFDFIVNKSDDHLEGPSLNTEAEKSVRYFLAALTIPAQDMWVNLSPYEEHRTLPDNFARTRMGQDLLAQDYLLKQLTASLTYPENEPGREFWQRVYRRAYEKLGTAEIPLNAFSKVWIVPESSLIYEHGPAAFILKSRLKVMMEDDFLLQEKMRAGEAGEDVIAKYGEIPPEGDDEISSVLIKDVLLPEIEREVNEGKQFAALRQIYHAVILASWYKDKLQQHLLARIYVNQNKTRGVEPDEADFRETIYNRYLEAFRQGAYNLIKEDFDPARQETVIRRYVSGGSSMDLEQTSVTTNQRPPDSEALLKNHASIPVIMAPEITRRKPSLDIRDWDTKKKPGQRIPGSPENLETWARVAFPRPQNRMDKEGRYLVAYWAMANALADILLDIDPTAENPYVLKGTGISTIQTRLSQDYGLDNIADEASGVTVPDLFAYLTDLGFLAEGRTPNGAPSFHIRPGLHEPMANWARLNTYIEQQLNAKAFSPEGQLQEQDLLDLIELYERAAEGDSLSYVEPYQPFLRAVLSLAPERRKAILDFLHQRFFEGGNAPFTGGNMIDALLLITDTLTPQDARRWAQTVFPKLTREGSRLYLVAAEIALFRGGLARVMQYLGRALKPLGMDVVFVEPRYNWQAVYDENGNLTEKIPRHYSDLHLPVNMPPRNQPAFTYTVNFDGQEVEVFAYEAINDAGILVYTFADKNEYYVQDVYHAPHDGEPVPQAASKERATLFQSKAISALLQELEQRRKAENKKQDKPYHPAVASFNDGQVLAAAAFRLFDPAHQDDALVEMYFMGTSHTVKNTFQVSQDDLRSAGIPEKYWGLFKNKSIYGDPVYDLSKGGLTAVTLTGGGANNVAQNHREVMWPYQPTPGGVVAGITNGDLLPLTMREWNRAFVHMGFAGEEAKNMLEWHEAKLGTMDNFQRAERRMELDNELFRRFYSWWDDPQHDKETRLEMFHEVGQEVLSTYFHEILSDEKLRDRLGLKDVPERFHGNKGAWIEDLSRRLVMASSGRGVEEKLGLSEDGMSGANRKEILEERARMGTVAVIEGNKQFYPGTNTPGQSVYLMNGLVNTAKEINSKGYPGLVIVEDRFPPARQLLLLAGAHIIVLDSDSMRTNGVVLEAGASESTEAHGRLFQGPAALHGFINYIAVLANYKTGRGTLFTPEDSSPSSYKELLKTELELFQSGAMNTMLIDAMNIRRAVDTRLTATTGYARFWNEKIETEEQRREVRVRETGRPLADILRDEYESLARPEGEVALKDATAQIHNGRPAAHADTGLEWKDGHQVLRLPAAAETGQDLELSLWVDGQHLVPAHHIYALLRDDATGRIYPMSMLERTSDDRYRFAVRLGAAEWHRWKENRKLTLLATGGSWYEQRQLLVSRKLTNLQRETILLGINEAAAANKTTNWRFDLQIPENQRGQPRPEYGEDKDNPVAVVTRGTALVVTLTIPLADETALDRLKVGVYTQFQSAGQKKDGEPWQFLPPARYHVEPSWAKGQAHFKITMPKIVQGSLTTFALFDAVEDLHAPGAIDRAIAWSNQERQDLMIRVVPLAETAGGSGTNTALPTTDDEQNLGGILLDPALMDRQVITDGTLPDGMDVPVPDEYRFIEGFIPILMEPQPATVTNLPLLLGLEEDNEQTAVPQLSLLP